MSDDTQLDLLARRNARLEVSGATRTIVFGEHSFEVVAEFPLSFMSALREGRVVDAVRSIFGEQAEEFIRVVDPSVGDVKEIADWYAVNLPSSLASIGS